MAQAIPFLKLATAAFGIYSGVKSYQTSRDAAKDQKKLSRQNAAYVAAEAGEQKRRAQLAEAKRAGTSKARIGASGLAATGSLDMFEDAQQEEFANQMGWLDKSAGAKQSQEKLRGNTAAATTRAQGTAALASSLGGSIDPLQSAGSGFGWW